MAGLTRRALGLAAAVLASAGVAAAVRGGWIHAKAQLAQVLLERAWLEARGGEGQARPWPWADTWPVARLAVPARGRDVIVLAGASGHALAFGPGHLLRSAPPGSPGNTVLAGHRDTHFRFLRDLQHGDDLWLETPDGTRRRYRVRMTRVVHERDSHWIEPTDARVLTLVTCWPFDALAPGGPLRFVVRAEAP